VDELIDEYGEPTLVKIGAEASIIGLHLV